MDESEKPPFLSPLLFAPWAANQFPFVNCALVLLNILWFAIILIGTAGSSFINPPSGLVIPWGADWGPLTLDGEPWRIISCTFVHIGVPHLLINMLVLLVVGNMAERVFGHARYLSIYLLTGAMASATSLLVAPTIVSAGASGSILGICGSLLGFAIIHRSEMPKENYWRVVRGTVGLFIACLIYSYFMHANQPAHIGGMIGGILCGMILSGRFVALKFAGLAVLIAGLFSIDTMTPLDSSGQYLLMKASRMGWCKQSAKALELCFDGERKFPRNAGFQREAAVIYWNNHDYLNALKQLDSAIQSGGPTEDLLLLRARALMAANKPEAALNDLNQVLVENDRNTNALALRALAYNTMNESALSLTDTRALLALKPNDKEALAMDAMASAQSGDLARADKEYSQIEDSAENNDAIRCAHTRVLAELGDTKKAQRTASSIRDQEKRLLAQAAIFLLNGDPDSARKHCLEAVKLDPQDSGAYLQLAHSAWALGDFKQAQEANKKCLTLSSEKSASQRIYYLFFQALTNPPQQRQPVINSIARLATEVEQYSWPAHMASYFTNKISSDQLVRDAMSRNELTEAHAYVGLLLQADGKKDQAKPHMQWVLQKGNREFVEYLLVKVCPSATNGPDLYE